MKLIQLDVAGFRSLKSQSWRPGDLNVLIGPNASGKSNLLRVLEMLNVAARGGLGRYVQAEGGMEPLVWDGRAEEISLRARVAPKLDPKSASLTYEIRLERLGVSSAYRIGNETILGNFAEPDKGSVPLLGRNTQSAVVYSSKGEPRGFLLDFDILDRKPLTASPESVPEGESLLAAAAGPFPANREIAEFQRYLASWKVHQGFHTHREAPIRAPQVTRTDSQIDTDGQNLISVLHSLYTGTREFKNELDTAMRAAFGDEFEELVFPPAADQRIQLRVRWRSLRREQSAADLSDGTLRFLYLLAILANPAPPALIAIDEPETGLHPSMLPIVAEYAVEASTRCQVVLTTHSPEFLDAFVDQTPTTTVVEWRDGETRLRVLEGDELQFWLRKYTLGDLYRSTELEAM